MVFFNGVVIRVAETAAYIVFFDARPAGLAGIEVDGRGVFGAMQSVGNPQGKVTVAAFPFLQCLVHRVVLFDEALVRKTRPP